MNGSWPPKCLLYNYSYLNEAGNFGPQMDWLTPEGCCSSPKWRISSSLPHRTGEMPDKTCDVLRCRDTYYPQCNTESQNHPHCKTCHSPALVFPSFTEVVISGPENPTGSDQNFDSTNQLSTVCHNQRILNRLVEIKTGFLFSGPDLDPPLITGFMTRTRGRCYCARLQRNQWHY